MATSLSLIGCGSDGSSGSLTLKGGVGTVTQATSFLEGFQSMDKLFSSTHGSPTQFSANLYAVYVSKNADCTDSVLAGGDGSTVVNRNFFESPTLFTGSPGDGTYQCMILKMQDRMTFRVNAEGADGTNSGCTDTTTEYAFDIYRSNDSGWKNPDGTTITSHGTPAAPVADTVYIYASTDTNAPVSGSIGVSENQVVKLTSALVVPGTSTMTVDTSNQVSSNSGHCWLERASFGFE